MKEDFEEIKEELNSEQLETLAQIGYNYLKATQTEEEE